MIPWNNPSSHVAGCVYQQCQHSLKVCVMLIIVLSASLLDDMYELMMNLY